MAQGRRPSDAQVGLGWARYVPKSACVSRAQDSPSPQGLASVVPGHIPTQNRRHTSTTRAFDGVTGVGTNPYLSRGKKETNLDAPATPTKGVSRADGHRKPREQTPNKVKWPRTGANHQRCTSQHHLSTPILSYFCETTTFGRNALQRVCALCTCFRGTCGRYTRI